MDCYEQAENFTNALASAEPTPGGGAAAAMAGAMGTALVLMALRTTLKRKSTPAQHQAAGQRYIEPLERLHTQLLQLMRLDAQAYQNYLHVCRTDKTGAAKQEALYQAACIPAQTAQVCNNVLQQTDEAAPWIAPIILSDVACARHLLRAARACCVENIRVNLACLKQPQQVQTLKQILDTLQTEN